MANDKGQSLRKTTNCVHDPRPSALAPPPPPWGFHHSWQAAYVKGWLVKAGLEEESNKLDLLFYPARYHEPFGSIFPMGDLAALVRRFQENYGGKAAREGRGGERGR